MLLIDHPSREIKQREYFDNRTQEFITIPPVHVPAIHLQLEHSLKSIAKWESKWHEPFMRNENEQMESEKFLDYIRCMTINPQKDKIVYQYLTEEDIRTILEYMQDPMSAHIIRNKPAPKVKRRYRETAESVYYAIVQFGIPMECENWHFNRLSALLDEFSIREGSSTGGGYGGAKKKNQRELMEMYRGINEANRKKYKSKG